MFVYECVNDKWREKLKKYEKPLDDGSEPSDYWYIDHEKQETIYYIGWVSPSILRCDGQALYEFAFVYKDVCLHIDAEIFSKYCKQSKATLWDERNKLRYNANLISEISPQELNEDIIEAILFCLDNIHKDKVYMRRK